MRVTKTIKEYIEERVAEKLPFPQEPDISEIKKKEIIDLKQNNM